MMNMDGYVLELHLINLWMVIVTLTLRRFKYWKRCCLCYYVWRDIVVGLIIMRLLMMIAGMVVCNNGLLLVVIRCDIV